MPSLSKNVTACPQCARPGSEKYCAFCGTPLAADGDTASEMIRSKVASAVIVALSFVKTAWLTWFSTARFLRHCFTGTPSLTELHFPLSSAWTAVDPAPQKVTRPFTFLASAIALVAVLGSLERAAWDINDFGKRLFGTSMNEMRAKVEAQRKEHYQAVYRREVQLIDTAHLTGVELLDKPLQEICALVNYAFFGFIAAAVLAQGGARGDRVVHAYVYLIGAAVAASALLSALGLVAFCVGALEGSLDWVALSGLGQLAGMLVILYLVVVLPIRVLPEVLEVPTSAVVTATGVAIGAWLLVRFLIFTILPGQLGVIVL